MAIQARVCQKWKQNFSILFILIFTKAVVKYGYEDEVYFRVIIFIINTS